MTTPDQPNDPLHGITLEQILIKLHDKYGWEGLASRIDIKCFKKDPSIKSSLKFLRKTPWARSKVESLYVMAFYLNNRPKTRGGKNTRNSARGDLKEKRSLTKKPSPQSVPKRPSTDPWGTKKN